jgi:SHS2 domain-containing protein
MDTDGEIPQTAEVRQEESGLRVTLAMADATRATLIGAVPKAVSLHELWFGEDSGAWRCTVTIDV